MYKKFCAFTLAEALITLGIIGVVAALSYPVLMNYIGNKYTTQARKCYADMQKLVSSLEGELGPYEVWPDFTNDFFEKYVDKRLAYVKKKEFNDTTNLVYEGYTDANVYKTSYQYLLQDGAVYSFNVYNAKWIVKITVDVNGNEGPNMFGVDVYQMTLNTSSDVRYGYPHGFGPAGMSYAKDDITKYCSRTSLANSWYTYGYIQGVDSQINYHSTCLAWLVNHNFQLKDYPIKKWGED